MKVPSICLFVLASAVPVLAAQDPYQAFAAAFGKAVEYNDTKNIDAAIRKHPREAAQYFGDVMWTWLSSEDEGNRKLLDALKEGWARSFDGSETLERVERLCGAADGQTAKLLAEGRGTLRQVWNHYNEARKNQNRKDWENARDGALNLAKTFEQLGHGLLASECWDLAQQISNNIPEKTLDDRRDAVFASEQFLEKRKSWQFTEDTTYKQHFVWLRSERSIVAGKENELKRRADAGYSADVTGADALVLPDAQEAIVDLQFAPISKLHPSTFARAGSAPPLWLATQVKETGPSQIAWFKSRPLFLVRPGSNKFGVTIDGGEADLDKNPWQKIETSTKYKPSTFYLGESKENPYAMWFFTGSAQEPLFGLTHNLEPQKDTATVFYRSAASWKGTVHEQEIVLFDDNCNGTLFEADPFKLGLMDRALGEDETPVAAFDSMKIGKAPPQPWSDYAKIGDKWYHLREKRPRSFIAWPTSPVISAASPSRPETLGG